MTDDGPTTRWPQLDALDRLRLAVDCRAPAKPAGARLVLVVLVRMAGGRDQLRPPRADLARATDLHRTTVGRCLDALAADGLIELRGAAVRLCLDRMLQLAPAEHATILTDPELRTDPNRPDAQRDIRATAVDDAHSDIDARIGSPVRDTLTRNGRDSFGVEQSAGIHSASAYSERKNKAPCAPERARSGEHPNPNRITQPSGGQAGGPPQAGAGATRPHAGPAGRFESGTGDRPSGGSDAAGGILGDDDVRVVWTGDSSAGATYLIRGQHQLALQRVVRAFGPKLANLPGGLMTEVAEAAGRLVRAGRFDDPAEAIGWLERRARAYACSPKGTSRYAWSARRWLRESGFDADDAAWGGSGTSPLHEAARQLREQREDGR